MNSRAAGENADEPERRVLLFVATRRDAEVSTRLLSRAGLGCMTCESIECLIAEIRRGAAAVLATDRILESGRAEQLVPVLDEQEEWSDLPLVLLMRGGEQSRHASGVLQKLTNVTLLDRPAGMLSVLSAVQAAVRGRLRQYETRAHIQAIRAAEAKAREAEARARHADRAKDEFLALLSHELRTPLTPVLLLATEASADESLSEDTRADFQVIAKNIALEARLIDDLLDLTRISRGKLSLTRERQDVVTVLRDTIATVRHEFAAKHLTLETSLQAETALVDCDPTRVQQVFWNVLKNAAKFTPPGGSVTVRTRFSDERERVIVEIEDTGIGMTPAELQRIFEAFSQGDHATHAAHRFGGLGLGLAISRSLVEMHSGTIRAHSAGPGHGSTFSVELPLVAPDSSTSPRDRSGQRHGDPDRAAAHGF